jgi:hypothetical protein
VKLTKSKLQQIIKEELGKLIEGPFDTSGESRESDETEFLIQDMHRAAKNRDTEKFEGYIEKAMDIARGYPEMKPRLGAGIQQMLSNYDDNDLRDMGIKDIYSAAMGAL